MSMGRPWVDHVIIDGAYVGALNALDLRILEAFNREEEATGRLGSLPASVSP